MQKGARRLQRKQSIDRSADFLVCHPSRRLATSILPPRKTAKYPSHRLAKMAKTFISPPREERFQEGDRKIFDLAIISASRRNPGAPENSAFTGFFSPPPLSSMSRTQHGTRIQNCCHIAHVRPCDRGRELIEGLARSCDRLQELIDGFVGTCQCHYNKAPADVYQPGGESLSCVYQ